MAIHHSEIGFLHDPSQFVGSQCAKLLHRGYIDLNGFVGTGRSYACDGGLYDKCWITRIKD